jgi:hypothetical protein
MEEVSSIWNRLSDSEKAEIINSVAYTIFNSDDLNMHISNIACDVFEEFGIDDIGLNSALNEISKRIEATCRR